MATWLSLTAARIHEVVKRWEDGLTLEEIVKDLQQPEAIVRGALGAHGITIPEKPAAVPVATTPARPPPPPPTPATVVSSNGRVAVLAPPPTSTTLLELAKSARNGHAISPDAPKPIGKIVSASTRVAYCEFQGNAEEGSVVFYEVGDRRIQAKVTYLQTSPKGHLLGNISILDGVTKPPQYGTALFLEAVDQQPQGTRIRIANDSGGRQVQLRLNALFKNLLIAGKTHSGKTHMGLLLAEELIPLRVPLLIMDPQNEFQGLLQSNPDRVVQTTETKPAIKALKERQVVIVPMLGLSDDSKAEIMERLVRALISEKERTIEKDPTAFPPVLTVIDEAEIFAPSHMGHLVSRECRDAIETLVKRGVKLGLGTILLSQRPPMLYTEVRSQCNSAAVFRLDDPGSVRCIRILGLTRYDIDVVARLQPLECLLVGAIVQKPTSAKLRPIKTPRTKNTDFEALLGLGMEGLK